MLNVLRPQFFCLALQRLLARAQVADGVNLELPEVGSERLTGDLDCNRLSHRRLEQALPAAGCKRRGKELAGNLVTNQLAQGASTQLQQQRIDVDDTTRLCQQQALVVPPNVERLPDRIQDCLRVAPARCKRRTGRAAAMQEGSRPDTLPTLEHCCCLCC
jgi:hypothetical protein